MMSLIMKYHVIFLLMLIATTNALPLNESSTGAKSTTLVDDKESMEVYSKDPSQNGTTVGVVVFDETDRITGGQNSENSNSNSSVSTLSSRRKREATERRIGKSVSLVYEACTVFFVLFGIWMTIILCVCIAACIGGPKVTEKLGRLSTD